jgi:hypothetical protein
MPPPIPSLAKGSDQPCFLETEISVPSDDDVIQKFDPDDLSGLLQPIRDSISSLLGSMSPLGC